MSDLLFLNIDIYNYIEIKKAILVYKDYANITLSKGDKYYICEFKACVNNSSITMMEFENYLIGLTRKNEF